MFLCCDCVPLFSLYFACFFPPRLVAKGCTQLESLYLFDTFSTLSKVTTVKHLLIQFILKTGF